MEHKTVRNAQQAVEVVYPRGSAVHQVFWAGEIQIAPEDVIILLLAIFEESEADPEIYESEN